MKKVIAICSGGLDSVSMASLYKDEDLTFMSFNYGQKGVKEVEIVARFAEQLKAKFKFIDISFVKELYGDSNQLTSDNVDVADSYKSNVVVPLRNALFLQIAMCHAYAIGADNILLGSHLSDAQETDGERLYPDCSYEFFKTFELACDLGTFKRDKKVRVITPSTIGLTKATLAEKGYGVLGDFLFETWSCYKSGAKQCGECESCKNRKAALAKAGIVDKTDYVIKT
jgi:7-cyano-7-deazaguanine synthase